MRIFPIKMIRLLTTLSLVNVLTNPSVISGQIDSVGTIRGKIIDAVAKTPISGCEVRPLQMGSSTSVRSTTSDEEGAFALLGIPKGTYFLAISCKGFSSKWVWSLTPTSSRSGFLIDDRKQEHNGAVIEMSPHSSISGWVSLPVGLEGTKLQIQTFKKEFVAGQPVYTPRSSSQTDPDGKFKLEGLPSGNYYLHISKAKNYRDPLNFQSHSSADSGGILEPSFYPGTQDITAATPISLFPGANLNSIEIKARKVPGYSVSGRLRDVGHILKGRLPLRIRQVSPDGIQGPILDITNVSNPDLDFGFKEIPSGDFQLELADVLHPGRLLWSQRISVPKRDLIDIELEISPLETILTTSLRSGNRPDRNALEMEMSRAYASFENLDNPTIEQISIYLRPHMSQSQKSLALGRNLISFHQLPEWAYLVDAKTDGGSVRRALCRTGLSQVGGRIDLEFAIGAGQIIAEVADADGAKLADAVVLIVAENELQPYRYIRTSQSGRAIFSNLAPGRYKVKGWATSSPEVANNPQSIAEADATGIAVEVGERSSTTVQIRVNLR